MYRLRASWFGMSKHTQSREAFTIFRIKRCNSRIRRREWEGIGIPAALVVMVNGRYRLAYPMMPGIQWILSVVEGSDGHLYTSTILR